MKTLIPTGWKWKLIILIGYAGLLFLWWYMDWECIMRSAIGFQCPGCGLTHAWLAAVNGNFIAAFQSHPMFWSIPLLVLYLIYDGEPLKSRKLNYTILFLILSGWIINYLLKIF